MKCHKEKVVDTLNNNWATKGATMVEKVALVRALRESFIEDLAGMRDETEATFTNKEKAIETPLIEPKGDPLAKEKAEEVVEVVEEVNLESL